MRRQPLFLLVVSVVFLFTSHSHAQRIRGELHIEVRDVVGAPLAATAELVSESNEFRRTFSVVDGLYVARDLPFGVYRLSLTAAGFAAWAKLVEIRSEMPVRISARLGLAPVTTQVEVRGSVTLLDPHQTGTLYAIGEQAVREQLPAQMGREVSDLVDSLPGWLYEANGVLHPRGSEYDVQYVIDGRPVTENRSPGFAPSLDADNVESLRVLTAGYPAEYGRKLGGIIEVNTTKDVPSGLHGLFDAGGGSFSTLSGSAAVSYAEDRNRFLISTDGYHTDRYLDPPVLQNFSNDGNSDGLSASYERDFSDRSRLRTTFTRSSVRFLVPNYLVQQLAGQRQDVADSETGGEVYFQHIVSPDLLVSVSGSIRDSMAALSSNQFSTPIIVSQDRGYREGYFRGDVAGHRGHHDWKLGLDGIFNPVHERLQYTITDPTQFDPDIQPTFVFSEHRWDVEPSAYIQDQIHFSNWNVSAGLRFDRYNFVVHESGWSPRVGISRYLAPLKIVVHASYDRVFQTPAMENLLLASSPELNSVSPTVERLPVQSARANFYELGFAKAVFGKLRLDGNVFLRNYRNYSDDDVLLDTGLSFPIAFAHGRIAGEELRLQVPRWGRFSGYFSYANQSGIGRGPITGGLFLGNGVNNRLLNSSQFAVSQDQRNTVGARVRFQAPAHTWLAMSFQYGSGLPADTDGAADATLLFSQYGAAIVNQVDLERGRVRPSLSFGAAAGVEIYREQQRGATLQIQATDLTNRVNVINFASVFSGTAVGPPRSLIARFLVKF